MLETDRLILRPYDFGDLPSLFRMFSDAETMAFWPAPFSWQETAGWMNRARNSQRKHRFGRWAVLLKDNRRLIGDCGLNVTEVNGRLENDLGWILRREAWGKGYATEAARAYLRFAFVELNLATAVAMMAVEHRASRRVAEKIGMTLELEFLNPRNRSLPTCLYRAGNTF